MHIIVLGGAGAMGRVTVRTLTEYEDVDHITIADYNEERARELAFSLKSGKTQVRQIDVNNEERLRSLLRGSDVVLSAVDYVYNLPVLRACIAEKVHYADLGGLFHMSRKLLELHAEASAAGITAILGMGGTPGITNMLARRRWTSLTVWTASKCNWVVGMRRLRRLRWSLHIRFAPFSTSLQNSRWCLRMVCGIRNNHFQDRKRLSSLCQ